MLTSTSPTTSAPPSPAFHFRKSPYHAPRRPSSSSQASSRSLQVTTASQRRPDAQTTPASHQDPVPSFSRSPQLRKRRYCDAGTQYSPDGYPPTYTPAPIPPPSETAPVLPPSQPPVPTERRATSAESSVTEPPEPNLRIRPHVAAPTRTTVSTTTPSRDHGDEPPPSLHTPRQHDPAPLSDEHSSPAKRARPHSGSRKVMPIKYETCDVKDLGVLVSDMLMELVRLNDDMPLRDGQLTRFHSR